MTSDNKTPLTYRDAGVDIDAGDALVDRIKPLAAMTRRAGAAADLGGFGGVFDLKAAGFDDPVLVSGTDGVGTKLKLAFETGLHDTIGIDLVAMCVNDVLAQGAEPLFFLDYFATGKLEQGVAASVVEGIAKGCLESGCALIGGETAEMPGMYADGHYDLAGFVVGAAERGSLLPSTASMTPGDALVAIGSSGPHSNGYSLVRRVVERSGLALSDNAPFAEGLSLGAALLTPTRLYVKSLMPLIKAGRIKGLAHITGGGLIENPPRMLPKHLTARIDYDSLDILPVFEWMAEVGGITPHEMRRTFNMGTGMLAAVPADDADAIVAELKAAGERAWVAGELATTEG
ncbi:MAG: phosphoribosylformylglycinamidine cyclo-ligase [Hirschia sp.]|nr:phosphoribosylformylglycinamidine cyclo-ligase [Hirschia sp.]MBF18123.1 phosphoribosylformylglycinamidine cyclo-ligase [Hirschia sp.]